jgi:hypothetical protein
MPITFSIRTYAPLRTLLAAQEEYVVSAVSPVIVRVTERIRDRSTPERSAYLTRVRAAQSRQPQRSGHACANLAHGCAAAPEADKACCSISSQVPNIGIVSAYNDILVILWGVRSELTQFA